jgi:hypothetical protein
MNAIAKNRCRMLPPSLKGISLKRSGEQLSQPPLIDLNHHLASGLMTTRMRGYGAARTTQATGIAGAVSMALPPSVQMAPGNGTSRRELQPSGEASGTLCTRVLRTRDGLFGEAEQAIA